jgi:small subunit ribosomal protein S16
MVKIRLARTGRKNHAAYRIVAVDSKKKRNTKAIEEIGFYLPHSKEFKVDTARVEYWISVGAQVTPTLARQLIKLGSLNKDYLPKKSFKIEAGRKSKERQTAKAAAAEEAKKPKVVEAPVAEVEVAAEPAAEAAVTE